MPAQDPWFFSTPKTNEVLDYLLSTSVDDCRGMKWNLTFYFKYAYNTSSIKNWKEILNRGLIGASMRNFSLRQTGTCDYSSHLISIKVCSEENISIYLYFLCRIQSFLIVGMLLPNSNYS